MRKLRLDRLTLVLALAAALPAWVLAQSTPPEPTAPPAPSQTQPPATPPSPGAPAPAVQPSTTEPSSAEPTPAAPESADPEPADSPEVPDDAADNTSLELVRRSDTDGKERRIRIVKTGTTDDTGIFAFCNPRDDDPEGTPTLAVFSETGPGGIQITIDQNVIRVPLAVVTQRPPKEGEEGSDGRVEASAGTARFLNADEVPTDATDRLTLCEVQSNPEPAPNTVFVTQGKTQLKGQKLIYDETDGIARIDGPVTFERANDRDPLTGSSEKIEVNVDDEKTTLVGNVVLKSEGGRVSKAGRVEYDDAANIARLIGTPEEPAESVKGGTETIRAGMILYDLERNEVYAVKAEGGTITGEFLEGEDAAAPLPDDPDPTDPQKGEPPTKPATPETDSD